MKNFIIIVLLLVSPSVFAQNDTISSDEQEMINQINILRANPKSYIPYVETYISGLLDIIKRQELAIKGYKGINKNTVVTSNTTTTTVTYSVKYKNVIENTQIREGIINTANKNIEVANELISVLNTTPPVPTLILDFKLYNVSVKHLKVLKRENKFCHECASDGTIDERMKHLFYFGVGENIATNTGVINSILTLLLDISIHDRGHRKTLLSIGEKRKWTFVSVAISDGLVVQNFAY